MVLLAGAAMHAQQEVPAAPPQGRVVASDESLPAERSAQEILPKVPVTDAERSAVRIDSYDLDVHLTPAAASEEVYARLLVRNISSAPVTRIALQLSGSLRWTTVTGGSFTQSPIATDADHTGYAEELVLTPAKPLAAGETLSVTATYGGKIQRSAARLELLGTPADAAAHSDWDAIVPTDDAGATALRGFGNVLWYPVAAPAALLGESNKLAAAVAEQRLRGEYATMRLRLTVEYVGDPPDGAIVNGRLQPLIKLPDEEDTLVGDTRGVATAEFAAAPLGFHTPSLFLTAQQPAVSEDGSLSVLTPVPDLSEPYRAAAADVTPLLVEYFGPTPLGPMLLLDHQGQAYGDGPLLVAQLAADAEAKLAAPALVRPLTHAWFDAEPHVAEVSPNTWLEEGVPELMGLLFTERTGGRAAALAELQHASVLLALAEPDFAVTPKPMGTPLAATGANAARDDVYLRLKSASVLWQLREIAGADALREALLIYGRTLRLTGDAALDAQGFQKALEKASGKDLQWFFDDWVYADKGLPDLTILQVSPRALPEKLGKSDGYLVAVEVRNEGDAAAEVPVTVRAGTDLTATERLRIEPHSTASTRILFGSTPESVVVNDGSVPEQRTTTHTFAVRVAPGS